jgi:hypothetical protein
MAKPSKIDPNRDFWFENKPSGILAWQALESTIFCSKCEDADNTTDISG